MLQGIELIRDGGDGGCDQGHVQKDQEHGHGEPEYDENQPEPLGILHVCVVCVARVAGFVGFFGFLAGYQNTSTLLVDGDRHPFRHGTGF